MAKEEGEEKERASRRARGSERVKRVRRRNGWKAKRGDQERGGISRADLPSCGEMADHHRRIIREPNIFSGLRY